MDNNSNWSGSQNKASNLQQYLAQFRNGQTMKTQQPEDTFGIKAKLASRLTGSINSPSYNDYRSDMGGKDSKPYLVANAMGKPLKMSETPQIPQMRSPSELDSYLNWVPTKDKFNYSSVHPSKKKLNTLTSGNAIFEDDSRRSGYSRTVLKGKDDSRNGFRKDDEISVDGFGLSNAKIKARAATNLKSMGGYKANSEYDQVSKGWGPTPKKKVLDELPWEDRQKLLGMSIQQVNSLKKEDILQAITAPKQYNSVGRIRAFDEEEGTIEDVLRKIVRMGSNYSSLREYVRILIKRWDTNNDGVISFQEVCEGLKQMEINLQLKDRVALMKKLDLNKDGRITEEELYKVLGGNGSGPGDMSIVNQTIVKIAGGAQDLTNMRQYARELIRRFDTDSDGVISL